VALAVAIILVFVLLGILWTAFAREKGPAPQDVALAYENAWDQLDFDLLYDLSGDELRDGLGRKQFIATKRAAYESDRHGRLGAEVAVEESVSTGQTALIVTRVTTPDGSVRNYVMLEHRPAGWLVVKYSIRA
jgi:hypothetical protein